MAFRATSTAGMREAALLDQRKSATDQTAPWRMRRGWLVRRMLLAADLCGVVAAFALAEILIDGRGPLQTAEWWVLPVIRWCPLRW